MSYTHYLFSRVIVFFILLSVGLGQSRSKTPSANTFTTLSVQANAARDANRLEEAASLYRRALTLRPSWAEGWWSLGTLEYDQDHYAKAATALRKLTALQPENGTAYAMLGLSEFELGRPQLALQHIEKGKSLGLQKNPDLWHVVLYHEGVLLQRKGSFQAAQDALEELCLEIGSNEKAADTLGLTLLRLRSNDAPAAGTHDAQVVSQIGRAACLAGQKKYDEARPMFEAVVKENPKYPNVHYAFGLFLIELRDVPGAVEQFKQEIANNPKDVVARLRIGAAEFKEDSASAIPYVEEAVKLDPQSPFGHYLLGMLRLDVDDYMKAIPELEIAERGMPREPKIYFALGTAYSRAGRRQDAAHARATFQRLTEQSKKSAPSATSADETRIRVDDSR